MTQRGLLLHQGAYHGLIAAAAEGCIGFAQFDALCGQQKDA
jgi:hypothetical protein